ncbi:putative ubiquinone biosynthesis monooxygenase [Quaeritorhiza haematococci]|nr:putative ubiquinone biosynthesis monooxygenase [Quaeritorhiza haematococci]
MVENNLLQAALAEKLLEQPDNLTVFNRARLEGIRRKEDEKWPVVTLQDGQTIKARVLVGADGFNSKVREFAKIESIGWDYNQRGIVATVRLDETVPNDTAWQRFLPTGPIALLPLGDGFSSIVWSINEATAMRLSSLSNEDFVSLLNAAFRNPIADVEFLCTQIGQDGKTLVDFATETKWGQERAGTAARPSSIPPVIRGVQDGSRAAFPLRMRNSAQYIQDRIALIGDAAHTTHPLAGQGMNLGLADAETLTDVLCKAIQTGQEIGNPMVLQQYAAQRYVPDLMMLSTADILGKLFGTDVAPVAWLRSLGLNILDKSDFVKVGKSQMEFASGLRIVVFL